MQQKAEPIIVAKAEPDPPVPPYIPPTKAPEPEPLTYLEVISKKYQSRLSAIIEKPNGDFIAYVDFLDSTYHVKERFTVPELKALGWKVTRTGYGLELALNNTRFVVVRPWPIDPFGAVAKKISTSPEISGRPQ